MIDRNLTVAEAVELSEVVGGVVFVDQGGSPDEAEVLCLGARVARLAAGHLTPFALRVKDGLVIVLAENAEAAGASPYDYEL